MNLKQKLIQETLTDAGQRIASIDANSGLIAECEAIAESLSAVGLETFPCITTVEDYFLARVLIFGQSHSLVIDKITQTGLVIEIDLEEDSELVLKFKRITLAGLTVYIEHHNICEELAQAA